MSTRPPTRAVLLGSLLACVLATSAWADPQTAVAEFAAAWTAKAGVARTKADSSLARLARERPWMADYAIWALARSVRDRDGGLALALLDSVQRRWPKSAVAALARADYGELVFPSTQVVDSLRRPRLDSLIGGRLPLWARRRLREVRLRQGWPASDRHGWELELESWVDQDKPPAAAVRKLCQDLSRTLPVPVSVLLARRAFEDDEQPTQALAILDSLGDKLDAKGRLWRGRVLIAVGRPGDALADFRKAAEDDPKQEEPLLWLGRGLERSGDAAGARVVFDEYARRWPAGGKGQEILWTRGLEEEDQGHCPEAGRWFRQVADAGGNRAEWARFREGYCWYRTGDWGRAGAQFATALRKSSSGAAAEAMRFFQAQSLRKAGRVPEADSLLRRLTEISPWSFHGHLARRILGQEQSFLDSMARLPADAAPTWPGKTDARSERGDSSSFYRVRLAKVVGDDWLYRQELSDLDAEVKGSGGKELSLVLWMRANGMEREAFPRARRLLSRLSTEEISKASRPLLRLFYPMHYLPEMQPFLRGDTIVDGAFVHALIRQESGFDPLARSPVGAMGLLQLMPSTARAMAKRTGVRFSNPEQLTDVRLNLRLGIAYMKDLARVWKGERALILATYNAGPLATSRWRDSFLQLPLEEAAEQVSYWETRDYVKKVMGNWWTYRALWPQLR